MTDSNKHARNFISMIECRVKNVTVSQLQAQLIDLDEQKSEVLKMIKSFRDDDIDRVFNSGF